MERTVCLIKPDGVRRELVGEIIARIERKGLRLAGVKMFVFDTAMLNAHYNHILDQPFFPELAAFMTSGPSMALCVEGVDSVQTMRRICGVTKAREAIPGTIRGDLAMSVQRNIVHTSDSPSSAVEEIARFFRDDELFFVDTSDIYSTQEVGAL